MLYRNVPECTGIWRMVCCGKLVGVPCRTPGRSVRWMLLAPAACSHPPRLTTCSCALLLRKGAGQARSSTPPQWPALRSVGRPGQQQHTFATACFPGGPTILCALLLRCTLVRRPSSRPANSKPSPHGYVPQVPPRVCLHGYAPMCCLGLADN